MARDKWGGLAKKWLQAKTTELTTADRRTGDAAEYQADEAARQLKSSSIEEAILTAVPGLRRLRDQQDANAAAAIERRDQERADELASRPLASLRLTATGETAGNWVGTARTLVEVQPGAVYDEDPDPYGARPRLTVAVGPMEETAPTPGSTPPSSWWFEIPGYTGPGSYDLAAIGMARRAAGAEPDYIDWALTFGEDGCGFYFQPDLGPSTVTITDSGATLEVTMPMTGEAGRIDVAARIELSSDLGSG